MVQVYHEQMKKLCEEGAIAHIPMKSGDRIIVLNHGRVEMEGTFDELPSLYFQ